jgi:diguanylate cyclase (GGDEF)-like protein
MGMYEKAFNAYTEVIESDEGDDFAQLRSYALINMSEILMDHYCPEKAHEYLLEALHISDRLQRKVGVAYCLTKLGRSCMLSEDYQKADEYFRQALDISDELDSDFFRGEALIEIAALRKKQGRLEEAEKVLIENYELSKSSNDPGLIDVAKSDLALLRIELGKVDGTEEILTDRLNSLSDSIVDLGKRSAILDGLCSLHEKTGNFETACRLYRERIETDGLIAKQEKRAVVEKFQLKNEIGKIELDRELLEKKAMHDPLTGLFNRNYLPHILKSEKKKAELGGDEVGILLIDVDHFKIVNDTYGHDQGDLILQFVAKALQDSLRQGDTIFRYGGDEFLVFLPQPHGKPELVMDRIRTNLEKILRNQSKVEPTVTLSMGFSFWYPSEDDTIAAALKEADERMYINKAEHS